MGSVDNEPCCHRYEGYENEDNCHNQNCDSSFLVLSRVPGIGTFRRNLGIHENVDLEDHEKEAQNCGNKHGHQKLIGDEFSLRQ